MEHVFKVGDMDIKKLFVYGTLMRPNENRPKACIKARMYNAGSFPCIVPHQGYLSYGEVFEVQDGFQDLDRYEGFRLDDPENSLYYRTILPVFHPDNPEIPMEFCYTYAWNGSTTGLYQIRSGVWER